MRILLVLFLVLSAACAKVPDTPSPEPVQSLPDCHEAWVYAPGNYILELEAQSTVTLNPKHWDFPLFCSAQEAGQALHEEIANQRLPQGHWALFRLEGDFHELASYEHEKILLQKKARLVDWQSWPKTR